MSQQTGACASLAWPKKKGKGHGKKKLKDRIIQRTRL